MSPAEQSEVVSSLRGPVPRQEESGAQALLARLERAAAWIREANQVWLGTHLDPDGDAIGSSLGLAHALRARGIAVTVSCQDAPPRETRFLPGVDSFVSSAPGDEPLVIALDTGDEHRLGRIFDRNHWRSRRSILLDHHASNPGFCDIDIIDHRAASTAEIVVALLETLDEDIGQAAATCLLTGIVTDTIGFRTSNTRASTLQAATKLMEAGASLPQISQEVFYRQPLASLKLNSIAIERLHIDRGVGITWILQEDFIQCGASGDDTREISRTVATIAELHAVAILREREDGRFDLSLRGRPFVNVIPVAKALGGGGHPQAAGARLDGPIDQARAEVRAALELAEGLALE